MEYWLTIAEIADKLGIPENTARRYAGKFSDFIHSKSYGRAKKYPTEAIQIIERISTLYGAGKSTDEIYEILQRDNPLLVEVEDDTTTTTIQPYDLIDEFRTTNALILQTMQQVSVAVEAMTTHQQELLEARKEINDLQKDMEASKQREQELLERIKQIEESQQRQRPWWKFWK